jgi:hypothetical protein
MRLDFPEILLHRIESTISAVQESIGPLRLNGLDQTLMQRNFYANLLAPGSSIVQNAFGF